MMMMIVISMGMYFRNTNFGYNIIQYSRSLGATNQFCLDIFVAPSFGVY